MIAGIFCLEIFEPELERIKISNVLKHLTNRINENYNMNIIWWIIMKLERQQETAELMKNFKTSYNWKHQIIKVTAAQMIVRIWNSKFTKIGESTIIKFFTDGIMLFIICAFMFYEYTLLLFTANDSHRKC